jgi:hypothetical protein
MRSRDKVTQADYHSLLAEIEGKTSPMAHGRIGRQSPYNMYVCSLRRKTIFPEMPGAPSASGSLRIARIVF